MFMSHYATEVCKCPDRDYWMTSGEALEYGMIDNIMGAGK